MIIVIIVNLILIAWLYYEYIYIPKSFNQDFKEMQELDSAIIGYMDDRWGNSVDWIFAEILELYKKGYIVIEYEIKEAGQFDYIIKKVEEKKVVKLKNYELTTYRILFENSSQITKKELEQKLQETFEKEENINIKSFSIRNEIVEELIQIGLLDKNKQAILRYVKRIYMIICIVLLITLKEQNALYMALFLIQTVITLYVCSKGRAFTNKGKKIKSKIEDYKQRLESNKLLEQKEIVDFMLQEKDYINSIALHIDSNSKQGLIETEIIDGSAKTTNNLILNILFIALLIVIYIIELLSL